MAVQVLRLGERQFSVMPGKSISRMEYHEKLNVILVGTEDGHILVLDTNLGDILYRAKIADSGQGWDFYVCGDRVIVLANERIGIRSEYNGILLLHSILQVPLSSFKEKVQIELSKTEAESLYQSLISEDNRGQYSDIPDFIKHLKSILQDGKETELKQDSSPFSVRREKWNTVLLEYRHSSLTSALQGVVNELLQSNNYIPQLSIASSILERLSSLLPEEFESQGRLDKSVMFSEAARLNTFLNWPHKDYKWAHPVKMAQAGFYHSPSTTGEDRAMCFTCNVCLVSWEPTDEPWSEHERHSPFCPFVRGEHTHNVPLTLTYATSPAFKLKKAHGVPALGKSSCPSAFPMCYPSGLVVIWDMLKKAKEVFKFEILLSHVQDPEPCKIAGYCDVDLKPKGAWVDDATTKPIVIPSLTELEGAKKLPSHVKLSKVALISSGQCPPSLVVTGGTLTLEDEWIEPWILIFGLSFTTLTAEDDVFFPEGCEIDAGGTKRETTQFEDDIFGPCPFALSDSELISSDSIVFSDTDSSYLMGSGLGAVPYGSSGSGSSASTKTVCVSISGTEKSASVKPKPDPLQPSVVLVQKLVFPSELKNCMVKLLEPTPDKTKLVVVVSGAGFAEEGIYGAIFIYKVTSDSNIVGVDPQPITKKLVEDEGEIPVASCFVPSDTEKLSVAFALSGGSLKIFSLTDLSLRFFICPSAADPQITSLAYCSSVEKLWCGTSTGFLYLYSTGLSDSDDDNFSQTDKSKDSAEEARSSHAQADLILNKPLNTASLHQLLQLTKFENVKSQISANAPSCWQKVAQAQKERKHPQHLHQEADLSQSSVSLRLQRNKDTKREHLFEIMVPKSAHVGHFDLKFAFQLGCTSLSPFEVTLYMARNVHNKRGSSHVEKGIDFGHPMSNRSEFLKSANAEIVCGPLRLSNHIDLAAQGGTLVMTSPLLLLSKGRHFFLHLKAAKSAGKTPTEEPASPKKKSTSGKSREHKLKMSSSSGSHKKFAGHPLSKGLYKAFGFSGKDNPFYYAAQPKALSATRNFFTEEMEKKKDLEGCDWVHEISITVRQIKESSLPNSELERKAMLTSPEFVRRLLQVVTFGGTEVSYAAQRIALDLLTWIAAIKLCGPQLDNSRYQLDFVEAVEQSLHGLILKCILLAERSTAHKCAKLLVICIDVIEVYYRVKELTFLQSLLQNLIILLPFTLQCNSAGALQWYFLILNRVRNVDPSLASETMLEMLNNVVKELKARNDPLHAILRSRFGLYGTPFEPDLFDIEVVSITKTPHPGPSPMYPPPCGNEHGLGTAGSTTSSFSGIKDVDFRDLLLANPVRKEKLGIVSPKQQIHGLLEAEPLHFSCHASSDGARIEKIDSNGSLSFSPLPMAQHWEPFTNIPTREGSKKTDPDKVEHVMLLQNLSKLNVMKMDQMDSSYYDYLNDIKLLEGNLNLIDMIAFQPTNGSHGSSCLQAVQDFTANTYPAIIMPSQQLLLQSGGVTSSHPAKAGAIDLSVKSPKKPAAFLKTDASPVGPSPSSKVDDSLRLLVSPWQQMMYVPTQQAVVIDRMHSGARRYVVLDFGGPILLTDLVIPPCSDLALLSIDIWLHREEADGERLVVATDISLRSLIINDLQPPPICRYLKITTIGRYGMGTAKCKIPLGMFYGHTAILPTDLHVADAECLPEVPVLSPGNTPAHLSILGYVLEDLGCRYQLACGKLKRLLEPLSKPEIASVDHISYYLPKGKERSKLGLNSASDQIILSSYQECITLQQQLNVTKKVIARLKQSLEPFAAVREAENPMLLLPKISSDKVRLISSFLVDSLLGLSFMASSKILDSVPYPLYANMTQSACTDLFQNICVMENGQCQLSACTFLLRICGFQPWWGNFLASTIKDLFSSTNAAVFPQDRVFTLLVYLGQKMLFRGEKSCVLESTMKLLEEILSSNDDSTTGFTRAKIDMSLLGWTIMYLCLCLDGVAQIGPSVKREGRKDKKSIARNVGGLSSRWYFIQGESVLHHSLTDNLKCSSSSGIKRRMQKKTTALKQKLEDLGNSASVGLALQADQSVQAKLNAALGSHWGLSQKVDKLKHYASGASKSEGNASTKSLAELLMGRRLEASKRTYGTSKGKEGNEVSDNALNLNPLLCYHVTKSLGAFLLKMDSTCHSDIYLLLCKVLARIATSCRPAMRLGEIFTADQILVLIQTAVGNDYVRQANWSSSWISHAIMCLILDLLEGEKLLAEPAKTSEVIPLIDNEVPLNEISVSAQPQEASESLQIDIADAENEVGVISQPSSATSAVIYIESESDYEDMDDYSPIGPEPKVCRSPRQIITTKDTPPSSASRSAALDSRIATGMESLTELRLRMMAAVDSELLAQALTAPIEVPLEVVKNVKTRSSSSWGSDFPASTGTGMNSMDLLAHCFDRLFRMMGNQNCTLNIEKVLLFWLNINLDLENPDDVSKIKPTVHLTPSAVSGVISALARNVGIGVQDWGLGFKCLSLVANQDLESGIHLSIIQDIEFPDMILKFISGSGMNLQRNHVPAMGPTVCEDFYNFFNRIFTLCQGTIWTPYLIEVLLRVLSEFLSGAFLGSEFPLDVFNKFLDILLSRGSQMAEYHVNPTVLISIVDHLAHALHLYSFFPNKIVVKSNAELKGAPPATTATGIPLTPLISEILRKPQNLESLLIRLLSLVSDIVTFPFGDFQGTNEQATKLQTIFLPRDLVSYDVLLKNGGVSLTSSLSNPTIADIVVKMDSTMLRIFSVLSNPIGKTSLSEEEMSSLLSFSADPVPTTISDFVIRLVSRIMSALSSPKQIVNPLFKFLAKSPSEDFCCPLIVSQMFVLTVLKVIKEEENLVEFVNSKCVQSICNKLVASSKQFFSSCPTFASIVMQYIGRADSSTLFGQRRYGSEITEHPGGIINVAPLGSISAVNFSAHPSEVLLQATPPHRRARAPVWSYHFYPEETFLELLVTLPCAVLLKEIQIVPHISSLATSSPSAVMVEISREKSSNMVAMSPPVQCGGMTTINIQLTQPEVAQTILLRLYKPKDSSTLGLSQIRILGCTTFCESAFEGLSQQTMAKTIDSCAQWMFVLDHAITAADPELRKKIIETAISIPDILQSCYSMLMCPTTIRDGQESYLPHVASVLLQFGGLADLNEKLMDALLGPVQLAFSHGMIANTNVQAMVFGSSQLNTVVELIYNLCSMPSESGRKNLTTVINWLEKCADEAVEESQGYHIVPEYVQSVAAALWSVTAKRKIDSAELATPVLLKKLFNWSKCLNLKSELKAAVDHMLCALCYAQPWLFVYLNFQMGILELIDAKQYENTGLENFLPVWYEEKSIWEHLSLKKLDCVSSLFSPLLMTLARAAESESATTFIFESGLLHQLNALILQFWSYNHSLLMSGGHILNESKSAMSSSHLIAILEFYSELCTINRFKDWFGTEGSIFWNPILHLLSIAPSNLKASCFGTFLFDLEYMMIHFLTRCCWSHPGNQKLIATRLCEIIVIQKQSPHKAVFLHSLSSFCRRLLIQVLLENEKMVVQVKNFTKSQFKSPPTSLPLKDRHPSMGVCGRDRVFLISIHSTAQDLISLLDVAPEKEDKLGRGKTNAGAYVGVTESIPASDIFTEDQMMCNLEDDVLQEILGFDSSLKMGMKIPSKKLKSDKSIPVAQAPSEPDVITPKYVFEAEEFPDVKIPLDLNLSKVKAAIRDQNPDYFLELLVIVARTEVAGQDPIPVLAPTPMETEEKEVPKGTIPEIVEGLPDIFKLRALPTTIEVFCRVGGFGLLSKHLPVVYPDTLRQMAVGGSRVGSGGGMTNLEKDTPMVVHDNDWVKVENPDDFYDHELMDGLVTSSTPLPSRGLNMKQMGLVPGIPPHSMAAFGLFLGLPKYAEVLLGERVGAQCMLRLAMGVTDDADGNDIFCSSVAKTLPTLPFQVLKRLLDLIVVRSEEGKNVRQAMFEAKAIHFILACLAIFTHQTCDPCLVPSLQHELVLAATKVQGEYLGRSDKSDDKSHVYWAKGTGFGTGSTQETWSVERAMEKRIAEEENVTCLLQVLSSYISPQAEEGQGNAAPAWLSGQSSTGLIELPEQLEELLQSSCLFTVISLYLRNDSVLDMARHIPLYTALLQFLRSIVDVPQLIPFLDLKKPSGKDKESQKISTLLHQMKNIVDSYSKRLANNSKKGSKSKRSSETLGEELQDEGLAKLICDIQSTACVVQVAVTEYAKHRGISESMTEEESHNVAQIDKSFEEIYLEEMKKLQFAFFEMIVEDEETSGIRFTVSHFYENNIRTNWTRSPPARLKRLAQESITLSTSLPIAFGSTIFVRCDTDRLDIMKVLITGPSGTPYSNGCFEFDIYFPPEYPNGPMLIHLQTTGRQRVRFNPNLYADGKVCLSILNTWHGRPEEKWNPQTSSLLPVLVAIQSLILNSEPYFNEPGYEKSRGTEGGDRSSREYNAGIQIATLEWAILDQIRHPSVCFKEVIHKHFWMKRNEILAQCEQWYVDLVTTCRNDKRAGKAVTGNLDPVNVFKSNLCLLRKEFQNMVPPQGLEFLSDCLPNSVVETEGGSAASSSNSVSEISQDARATQSIAGTPGTGNLVVEFQESDGEKVESMIVDGEAY